MTFAIYIAILAGGYAAGAATFAPLWLKARRYAQSAEDSFVHIYDRAKEDAVALAEEIKQFEDSIRKAL